MSTLLSATAVALPGRLQPVDLQLQAGTLTALIGPNGGGKTSLLRGLARIERSAGCVQVAGEDVDRSPPPRRRHLLSFLPASREVHWPIAARDLIALGLDRRDPARVDALLGAMELEALANRAADRLSTGERARVLLARALAARPAVLLLDEPLSNLDPYWVLRTLAMLRDAVAEGATALVSLHDLTLLPRFNRALLVAGGRILDDAAPHQVLQGQAFETAFAVRPGSDGWQISPAAGRRSSR